MEIYKAPLDVKEITNRWYDEVKELNYGAFITFIGTVRDESEIEALSFDIYEPILKRWFQSWEQRAKSEGAIVKMAHSIGDVKVHESSYISAVISPKREVALRLIEEFVEDFKANAPIWKYDVIKGERIYAEKRSTPMDGAGILGEFSND
jgi:molybdopterin synthase catalytic subunit